jgi:uncharacterized repeat protein (TIGR03803 family)
MAFATGAVAHPLKQLHSFCTDDKCHDGAAPGGLVRDSEGNLFGVATSSKPSRPGGVVFEMVHGRTYKMIYRFCRHQDCAMGATPDGNLIVDTSGNIYGTASAGGAHDNGVAFKLSHDGRGHWTYMKLYDFCAQDGCIDGAFPGYITYDGADRGAFYDGASPIYGTARGHVQQGVVYALAPVEEGAWTETVLHTFCTEGGQTCTDGGAPQWLTMDPAGNLFGATPSGGAHSGGTVFELSPAGGGSWTWKIVHDFCATDCSDGSGPLQVMSDLSGNIYGVTWNGGGPCSNAYLSGDTCGVIFVLTPGGGGYSESILRTFCLEADCADGAEPLRLLLDGSGKIFGTTTAGGGHDDDFVHSGGGVLFELDGSSYRVLHSFCAQSNAQHKCTDGQIPNSLLMTPTGTLFGLTELGGAEDHGSVYKIRP